MLQSAPYLFMSHLRRENQICEKPEGDSVRQSERGAKSQYNMESGQPWRHRGSLVQSFFFYAFF